MKFNTGYKTNPKNDTSQSLRLREGLVESKILLHNIYMAHSLGPNCYRLAN